MLVQVDDPPVAQLLVPWHSLISAEPKTKQRGGIESATARKNSRKGTEKKFTSAGHPDASVTGITGASERPRSVRTGRCPRRAVGGSSGTLVDVWAEWEKRET